MRAKVLIDNIAHDEFIAEWGLSIWIEYEGHALLLDTGATGCFARNADAMGVDLSRVEAGVLSHAHYDHANGIDAFFERNAHAKFYLRYGARENCYGRKDGKYHYNGVRKGMLREYAGRFEYVRGNFRLIDGAWLIPHSSAGLEKIAARSGLYVRRGLRRVPDDFSHEQSLVFETQRGLAIFNSCSHAGPDNIVAEVAAAFPEKKICAYVGGLHLSKLADDEVRDLALRMRETRVEHFFTGHCTGERAFELLKAELGERVEQIYTGMEIEV